MASALGSFMARQVPLPFAVLAVVVAGIVFLVLGGVVLGSGGTKPVGPGPVARQAADAWLAGRAFVGPRAGGVPTDLGRFGRITASLQPSGQWHNGSQAGETFIVTVVNGSNLGLTVVTDRGKLAFSPTLSALPFVIGKAPPTPPRSVTVGGGVPRTRAALTGLRLIRVPRT